MRKPSVRDWRMEAKGEDGRFRIQKEAKAHL
jgi:hypothetical protein